MLACLKASPFLFLSQTIILPFQLLVISLKFEKNITLSSKITTRQTGKRDATVMFGLTCDVVALGHDLHDADGLVLLDLVGLVLGLAVRLVVRGADLGADGLVAALPHDGSVAHVHSLVEGLKK